MPEIAGALAAASARKPDRGDGHELLIPGEVAATVSAKWSKGAGGPAGDEHHNLVVAVADTLAVGANQTTGSSSPEVIAVDLRNGGLGEPAPTLPASGYKAGPHTMPHVLEVAHGLTAEGHDATRVARNGRGAPDEVAYPLTAEPGRTGKGDSANVVAFNIYPTHGQGADLEARQTEVANAVSAVQGERSTERGTRLVSYSLMPQNSGKDFKARPVEVAQPLVTDNNPARNQGGDLIQSGWNVRRLTPLECERLQGFPDGYTAIDVRGKPAADAPRYKALGNSMAVNVMEWIGERIALIDAQ